MPRHVMNAGAPSGRRPVARKELGGIDKGPRDECGDCSSNVMPNVSCIMRRVPTRRVGRRKRLAIRNIPIANSAGGNEVGGTGNG
jgi:hypothetical protein